MYRQIVNIKNKNKNKNKIIDFHLMKTIKNGQSYKANGWTYISIKGKPRERGFAHGYLAAEDFKKAQEMMRFSVYEETGKHWDFFIDACKIALKPTIIKHFHEFYEEMEGISEGCNAAGTKTNIDEIIAWNNYITLLYSWYPSQSGKSGSQEGGSRSYCKHNGGSKDRCSSFIANGDYTEDGSIVIAHNSFTEFMDGQYYNFILDIFPTSGHRILMQTQPCSIWSGTDVFITSKGIMGTETTIGGFNAYENN